MASLSGRLQQAAQMSFPVDSARRAIAQIISIYVAVKTPPVVMKKVLLQLAGKYRVVFKDEFKEQLMSAIACHDSKKLLVVGDM